MFGIFRKNNAPAASGPSLPMGLRLGGALRIDDILFRANPGAFGFDIPSGEQLVEALGSVDLGGGSHLQRLYLSDDAWLQLSMTGEQIDDLKLFSYADTRNPPTKYAFQQLAQPGSELGQPGFLFGGHRYERVWSMGAPGWVPPIVYDEKVRHAPGGEADYSLVHYSMLYQRLVPGLQERYEYLLATLEDYSASEFLYVISLGCDVTDADLTIL